MASETQRNQQIQKNMPLMYMVANRFLNRNIEKEDLYQVASIGLIKAVDNFDPTFNVQFSTYAVPVIIGEIKRYLRDNTAIHISRSCKEIAAKAMKIKEEIQMAENREPTLGEIAEKLSLSPEDVGVALSAITEPASLDEKKGESEISLYEQIPDENQIDLDEHLTIKDIIKSLPEREQNIIKWRYLQELSQQKVATRLGISQVQVSRLEKKILTLIRSKLA